MDSLTSHYSLMVEAMDPLDVKPVVSLLTKLVQDVARGVDQVFIIAKAAITQHKLKSKYVSGDNVHPFGCICFMTQDVPFSLVTKYPRVAPFLRGRPINIGSYGGEVFLHMKYVGVNPSIQGDGDALHHFHVPPKGVISKAKAEERVRDIYLMFRNWLNFNVPSEYLEAKMRGYVTTTISPFASQQVATFIPFESTKLIASEKVVENVLEKGVFAGLNDDEYDDAEYIHKFLTSMRLCGDTSNISNLTCKTR